MKDGGPYVAVKGRALDREYVNLSIFLKEAYFLIIFVIRFLLQARYILIIQDIPAFSIYLIVELIFENSQFGFKVLGFSTR